MKFKLLGFLILALNSLLFSSDRPNVVFILADDLGYGDVKAFGGKKSKVPTPHFDQLCRDGMKFTNAHVTNSVCVPSRTSIMTGRYAFRFAKGEQGGPWGFIGLQFPSLEHGQTVNRSLGAGRNLGASLGHPVTGPNRPPQLPRTINQDRFHFPTTQQQASQ